MLRPKLAHLVLVAAVTLLAGVGGFAYWYLDLGHESTERLAHLHSLTLEQVVEKLGPPDRTLTFTISDSADNEFRVGARPPVQPESAPVRMKELWWDHSRYTVTVWFHEVNKEWVVLDTVRWKKGI